MKNSIFFLTLLLIIFSQIASAQQTCTSSQTFMIVDSQGQTLQHGEGFCGSPGAIGYTVIQDQTGSAAAAIWCDNERLDLNYPFSADFSIRFTNENGGGAHADGITFTMHKSEDDLAFVGGAGGDLGYRNGGNVVPSVAVEFDIFDNGTILGDIPQDHSTINFNGSFSTNGVPVSNLGNIEDGSWHQVHITWNPCQKELCVDFDGTNLYCYEKDLIEDIFQGDGTNVIWGFTAARWNHGSNHDICFCNLAVGQRCNEETIYCCTGRNLIQNGSFEDEDTGFSSDYMYQPITGLNSIIPGQYGIINGADAAIISPTWNSIQDPTTCLNRAGRFLIINGENGGGDEPSSLANSIPPTKTIWEQTVIVEDWRDYKFCFEAKNLNQCGFNVVPKLEVQFSMPFGNITETISISSDPCAWQEITKHLHLYGYGNSLNIKIVLDQREFGDGNDIAIDNIALIELPEVDDLLTNFGISRAIPLREDLVSVIFDANSVPAGCGCFWEVCELNDDDSCYPDTKVSNASEWWSLTDYCTSFSFQGYKGTAVIDPFDLNDPGEFDLNKTYRITRGAFCECEGWNQVSLDLFEKNKHLILMDSKSKKIVNKIPLKQAKVRKKSKLQSSEK